jgi:hypothetical protein
MSDDRELARDRRAPTGRVEDEAALDHALAGLRQPEVDPLWSRATQVAAQRRLRGPAIAARMARYEPLLLVVLSAAQLLWAALRVFAFAR